MPSHCAMCVQQHISTRGSKGRRQPGCLLWTPPVSAMEARIKPSSGTRYISPMHVQANAFSWLPRKLKPIRPILVHGPKKGNIFLKFMSFIFFSLHIFARPNVPLQALANRRNAETIVQRAGVRVDNSPFFLFLFRRNFVLVRKKL